MSSKAMEIGGANPRAWFSLSILVLIYTFAYLDRSIIALMVEDIKRDLDITDLQFGVIQGFAFAIFYGIMGYPVGWLADRYSRRAIIFAGVIVWSFACMACGMASNFYQLVVGRFILGAGEATVAPSGMAILGDEFPRRRIGLATNIFKMGALFGGTISFALGGFLIAWAVSRPATVLPGGDALHPWQLVLILAGLPGLLIAFLVFLLPRNAHRAHTSGRTSAPLWPFLAQRRMYSACVLAGGVLYAIPAFAGLAWLPAFLIRRYNLPIEQVGAILSLAGLGSAFGSLFFGWLADQLFARGFKAAHLLGGIFAAPFLVVTSITLYIFVDSIPIFSIVLTVHLFLSCCATTLDGHIQIASPNAYRARMAAMYGCSQHLIAFSIGPAFVAFLTDKVFGSPSDVGYALAVTSCITAPLGAVALFIGLKPAARAVETAQNAPDTNEGKDNYVAGRGLKDENVAVSAGSL